MRVVLADGREHTARVPPAASLSQLRSAVAESTGVAPQEQTLIYRGRVLGQGGSVAAAGICDGHVVHLTERPPDAGAREGGDTAHARHARFPRDGEVRLTLSELLGATERAALEQALLEEAAHEMDLERNGDFGDFSVGFFWGLFLSVGAVFCLLERNVPRMHRSGIVVGIAVNFIAHAMASPDAERPGGAPPAGEQFDEGPSLQQHGRLFGLFD